jgi:Flp pilus assembly protein CpaB
MSNIPSSFGDSFPSQGGFGGYVTPPGAGDRPVSQPPPGKQPGAKRGGDKPEKAPTKRLMNTQKILAVVLAVVVGAMALLLSSAPDEKTFVVRTTQSIPALSQLSAAQIEAVALPVEAVEEDAVTAPTADEALELMSELLDKGRVRMELSKGHQLKARDFTADALLANPLGPDERLISVEASVVNAVGGQLRAGDRIDIVVVAEADIRLPDGTETRRTLSNVVAYNVEIVSALPGKTQFDAISQEQIGAENDLSGNALLPNDPVPGIYNIRVTVEQAVILSAAGAKGELYLLARGAGATDTVVAPIDLEDALRRSGDQRPAERTSDTGTEAG